jgi:hypothetical protein
MGDDAYWDRERAEVRHKAGDLLAAGNSGAAVDVLTAFAERYAHNMRLQRDNAERALRLVDPDAPVPFTPVEAARLRRVVHEEILRCDDDGPGVA